MRATEDRLIPAVQRFTFPPEAAPHSVASQPPPSYVTPAHARSPPPRSYGISLDAFEGLPGPEKASADVDGTTGVGRYILGRKVDVFETALNKPQQDYTLLHSFNPRSAECAQFGERTVVGRGGRHAKTIAYTALADKSEASKGPSHDGAGVFEMQAQAPLSHHTAFDMFKAVSKRPVPPFIVELGVLGSAGEASGCASDHNPYAPQLARSSSQHHLLPGATPKDLFQESMHCHGGNDAVDNSSCELHLRATAHALRSYNILHPHHRKPSAISMTSTAFARSPKAPHIMNPVLASPSERIAANYSQPAWGLSARTLQHLSRAAIAQPAAPDYSAIDLGSLGNVDWRLPFMPLELFDDEDAETKMPQEWLASAPDDTAVAGSTEWLNISTGQTELRRVHVKGYDEISCTFQVEFLDSKVKKSLKRLNLIFDAEDRHKFAARVKAAKTRRAAAEADIRWRFFIDSSTAEEVLDVYDFNAKVEAVYDGCRGVAEQVLDKLKAELVKEFYESYCLGIRIGHFEYHRLNVAIEQQLVVLGLPPPKHKRLVPHKGVIDVTEEHTVPSSPFSDVRTWARRELLMASPVLNAVLQVC